MKIVLVEDDKFLRSVLERKLSENGFQVVSVINGNEALEKILIERPELILLDIILPQKSGFFILEKIKQDPQFKNVPVLVISNLSQAEDIEKAKNLGASEYLVKAKISLEDLVNKVKSYKSKTS
ncbi:MAG: hypothetical protein KatS3mg097_182 [Candidatus Parcubacteria bacterium]|nr:MAG: hypothetical protein KatS3mg097_182 [Candidatus Parcubacteria bacterium]